MIEEQQKKEEEPELQEEPSEDEEQSEELTDAEFISSVIRAPKQGTYEQFLCQLLAQAVICTDPLKHVKIVSEVAWTIKEPERDKLAIDYERVRVLNADANAFLNYSVKKVDFCDIVSIPWGFSRSEESFKKYIAPWFDCYYEIWPHFLKLHVVFGRHVIAGYPEIKEIIREPLWSYFFDASNCLTVTGYNCCRNAFIAWASPQAHLYLAELTDAVDPNTYRDILGLYKKPGRRDYAQKVRETAKPAEGRTDENSLG